ncbi:zinc-binding dehydrogenase [Mongoliitalea daihaiensis]|uniref:zinc-binding dehydrogenase n=1 Tax=Mongoliitalea daihaiensis TaxID=2782006 RepID=UPI001F17F732|nr:zinc-binding dehydrogenase [Mongoliitalea daihaiensis]UJP64383.1 zinc-binding dehydrogenase [Mongoliitalea daihaiensis]
MKAVVLNRSVANQLEIKNVEKPKVGEGEVIVQVKAGALNHRDEWCRQGLYPNLKDGVILGSDGAGVVVELGEGVDSSWLKKEVIINPSLNWGEDERVQVKEYKILGMPDNGTLAEFINIKTDRLHEKPSHLSWEEAAALPLGGLTAFRALMVQGRLQKDEKVLVTGFGGGVAQFAVQFAIAAGAEVYVSSSSEEKRQKALSLGVTGAFDYTNEAWVKEAIALTGGFDLIIDSAVGDTFNNLIKLANPGARIVFYGATKGNPTGFDARKVFWNQLQIIGSTMGSDKDFEAMLNFVNQHQIKPVIDHVFSLDEAVQAFDRMKAGSQMGKIVLKG